MPCDPHQQQFDDSELIETLSEIEGLVTSSNECEIIWCGDLNYDPNRNNHFTGTVPATLLRLHLTSVWEGRNIDYTHVHTDGVGTSTLDHFKVSQQLLDLVEDCGPGGITYPGILPYSSVCDWASCQNNSPPQHPHLPVCRHGTKQGKMSCQPTPFSFMKDFRV